MDDELLKKISKEGNLHPSNKVMDILRKIVRATKEEDAKICEKLAYIENERGRVFTEEGQRLCYEAIRASK